MAISWMLLTKVERRCNSCSYSGLRYRRVNRNGYSGLVRIRYQDQPLPV